MKKNIAILAGGYSSEYHISLLSAEQIAFQIDTEKYQVYIVNIQKEIWQIHSGELAGINLDKNDFSFLNGKNKEIFYCVFPAIHGTPGEDGILQAYFDMLKISYIGSSSFTSALTFSKFQCNTFLKNFDINISDADFIRKGQSFDENKILKKTGVPCFVKPNSGGSSFGISKVKKKEDFNEAVKLAFEESDEIIVEKAVNGREISCGMIEISGKIEVLPLAEIISKNEFFDYQAKYNSDLNEEIVPAPLPEFLTEKCKKLSEKICKRLNCKGISRIDYILQDEEFYFIEINTMPGMTKESIVPKMIREANLSLTEIFSELIEEAVSLHYS